MSEKDKEPAGIKIICDNRKAFHNFAIEDRFEAGLVLTGTEVKSLRAGKAHLNDAYGVFKGNDLFLINAHIAPYDMGNRANHEALRSRKMLLHRAELNKLWGQVETGGYHLIPTKMYFKKGKAKVEIGLGKSKKQFDKRRSIKDREMKREVDRAVKRGR